MLGRLAGGIRAFDDAYSAKIAGMYSNANPAVQAASYMVGGAHPSFRKGQVEVKPDAGRREKAMAEAINYALPIANAVPKYVIPAAGITAAGMGLLELTDAMNQQTDGNLYMG